MEQIENELAVIYVTLFTHRLLDRKNIEKTINFMNRVKSLDDQEILEWGTQNYDLATERPPPNHDILGCYKKYLEFKKIDDDDLAERLSRIHQVALEHEG